MKNDLSKYGFEPDEVEASDDLSKYGFEEDVAEDAPTEEPKGEEFTGIPDTESGDPYADTGREANVNDLKNMGTLFAKGSAFGLTPLAAGAGGAAMEALDIKSPEEREADTKLKELGIKDTSKKEGMDAILDEYYKSKEMQMQAEEKAFEESPGLGFVAEMAGGMTSLGPAAALGKASKVAKAVLPQADELAKGTELATKLGMITKEGAKAGALTQLGQGEAKLLEGDVGGTASELLEGAAYGGAGGLLLGGVPTAGKELFKKVVPGSKSFEAGYKLGEKGVNLKEDSIKQSINNLSNNIYNEMRNTFKKAGLSKAEGLEFANEVGVRVNAGSTVKEAMDEVSKLKALSTESAQEKQKFVSFLQGLQGEDQNLQNLQNKIQIKRFKDLLKKDADLTPAQLDELQTEKIDDYMVGKLKKDTDPVEEVMDDLTPSGKSQNYSEVLKQLKVDPIDLENASLSDIEALIGELNTRYTNVDNPNASGFAQKAARQLASDLRALSNNAIENSATLSEANKRLSSIFKVLNRGNIKGNILTGNSALKDDQVDRIRKLMISGGDNSEIDKERFFQYLSEASPEFANLAEEGKVLQQGLKLSKTEDVKSTNIRSLLGSYQSAVGKAGNLAGLTKNKLKTVPAKKMREGYNGLIKMAPESAQGLIQRIEQSGVAGYQNFVEPLKKAYSSNERTKTALLYTLYQQPAFRKMLSDVGEVLETEDDGQE